LKVYLLKLHTLFTHTEICPGLALAANPCTHSAPIRR